MRGYLPPGPIFGMPVTEPLVTDGEKSDDDGHANKDDGSDDSGKLSIQYAVSLCKSVLIIKLLTCSDKQR